MAHPKALQFVFGTVLFLFFITLVNHVSSPTDDDVPSTRYREPLGSNVKQVAQKIKPFFSGSSSLGSIRNHLKRSETNYQMAILERKELMKDYPDQNNKPLFPCNSHDAYWKTPFSIWDFVPAAFNCPHSIQRIGRMGDGGKWLCGLERHVTLPATRRSRMPQVVFDSADANGVMVEEKPQTQPGCIIYSFGIQFESTFEEQLLERTPNCQIWGYDFSVTKFGPALSAVAAKGRAHFTQAGIQGQSDPAKSPPFYSIQDLMAINGHDHIDILKMDIEGYEFESMQSFLKTFVSQGLEVPIAQFLVEIHLEPNKMTVDQFMSWIEMMENAGFRPVWTEPNLLVSTIPLFDGMPRYAEYTFINIKDSKSVLLK